MNSLTSFWSQLPYGVRSVAHTFLAVFASVLLLGLVGFVQNGSFTEATLSGLFVAAARSAIKAGSDAIVQSVIASGNPVVPSDTTTPPAAV